jgi:hypothetical protein
LIRVSTVASGLQGAKLKKWRLIVRNLPFMVIPHDLSCVVGGMNNYASESKCSTLCLQLKEQTLRQLFAPSGFVWEITIPRKPDNSYIPTLFYILSF